MANEDAELTRWKVTGLLGEGVNWPDDVALGGEVLVVMRGTVSRSADTLDDGDTVRTVTVKVTSAARVGSRSTLAQSVRKLLADTAGTLDV